MTDVALPTPDQIRQLPASIEAVVTDEFIDANGHMNIRHYLELDAIGADRVMQQVGIVDAYREQRRMGAFTAEQHLLYYSELHLEEQLTVHPRVIDRSAKAVHMMVFLLDATHQRLANTMELMMVHVDLDTRRPTDFPPDVITSLDSVLEQHRALDWEAPLCGAMGIRRPA